MLAATRCSVLRQLVIFPTNRLIDQSLNVVIPIARTAIVTDTERNGNSTEDVTFVRPLVKSNLFDAFPEVAPFAKFAPLFVLIIGHADASASP
jgi:hypothetical protein